MRWVMTGRRSFSQPIPASRIHTTPTNMVRNQVRK